MEWFLSVWNHNMMLPPNKLCSNGLCAEHFSPSIFQNRIFVFLSHLHLMCAKTHVTKQSSEEVPIEHVFCLQLDRKLLSTECWLLKEPLVFSMNYQKSQNYQKYRHDTGTRDETNLVRQCWSVPGINNLHMPWKRGKVKVLSFLKGPCLPWNASFLVSDSTKSFKLFITDIAVSCTVLFNVSWVFPFLQKNVHVFWFSTVTAVQLMNFHVCCLFCPGFFFWLVGLVGFFNYLIQVIFTSLSLLPLCFTSIIIMDVPPLPRKQKSPSYFLLDWQNFSFKAHWLH